MKKILLLLFLMCSVCYSQSKEEREQKLKERKETKQNDDFRTYLGVSFQIGDTLIFNDLNRYSAIFKGRGISIKQIDYSLKNTKCVIFNFKNQYGYDYTFCKDLNNQTYMLSLDSAIALNEIKLNEKQITESEKYLNPEREIPEDYTPFVFQGVSWNTKKPELIKLFPTGTESKDAYSVSTNVIGLDASLLFSFYQNNLNIIGYVFNEKHSNYNLYIEDYLKLKKILIEKYGEPAVNNQNWRDSLFKNDYESYGLAISRGDLEYYTKWELPDTSIILKLSGDKYDINLILGYYKYPQDKRSISESDLSKF